jgi:hypothetical protein
LNPVQAEFLVKTPFNSLDEGKPRE